MDVVTFGEAMAVLVPEQTGPLEQVTGFRRTWAGAESTVAVGLARLGCSVQWVSVLGIDPFGTTIFKALRGEGVDVSSVRFDERRSTGLMVKEFLGPSDVSVYYYRAGSAASRLGSEVLSAVATRPRFLFLTGITPALSAENRELVFQAVAAAKAAGTIIVFDPNYRRKLWSEDEARPVLLELARLSDVLLMGHDEAAFLTGRQGPEAASVLDPEGTKKVVIKLGDQGATWYDRGGSGIVDAFSVAAVDEIGAGDAFSAGLLSGLLEGLPLEEAVRRGCACGALAVTTSGDWESLPTKVSLERFLSGQSRIKR